MKKLKLLFVEDDPYFRQSIKSELSRYGQVTDADTLIGGANLIETRSYDVAFLDLNLTDTDAMEGLQLVKKCCEKGIIPIVLTGHDSKEVISRAYEIGCHYYFTKADFEKNIHERVGGLLSSLIEKDFSSLIAKEFITKDTVLISKLKYIREQAVNRNQNILITGPTGVGKTKIAKLIHKYDSPESPFIHVNLSELPETLIESELFGHKKGSFTGAVNDKEGLLSKANGGTLFLDEIGTIPLHIQKKLLKVIEEKSFYPVGGTELLTSDFRLVTATCDNLSDLINKAVFRIDFYFRIKGIEVEISSLKDRRDDIIPLLDHFIAKSPRKISLDEEAEAILQKYDWYGNVRELENTIRELITRSQGIIKAQDLPSNILTNTNPISSVSLEDEGYMTGIMKDFLFENGLPALIKEIEKEAMAEALASSGGKINEVGRRLKISKSLLYRINKEINETAKQAALCH